MKFPFSLIHISVMTFAGMFTVACFDPQFNMRKDMRKKMQQRGELYDQKVAWNMHKVPKE